MAYCPTCGQAQLTEWPHLHVRPVPRSRELDQYEGQWVAVKDGKVVAHAVTSRELVPLVRALGSEGEDAVVEYVHPPTDSWRVGVG